MTYKYPMLFSSLRIKRCVFPNRIMSTAAVTRLAAEDGHVTDCLKERYKRMAVGGLGSMVIEAAAVLPSKSSFNLRISDDQFVPGLTQLVRELHDVNPDLKVGLQLLHFLKVARSGWRQKVEDLKPEEIAIIPEQFSQAAVRARAAGFDFIELHMAHFTTLASFLSLVNKRQDLYGCDFEGRVKLPTEVVNAVRETVGGDFPVGVRINGEEFTKEGNTLLQSSRIGCRLAKSGVDYISVSAGERFEDAAPPLPNSPPFAGTGYSGYRMSPRWWNPDGVQVYLAEGVLRAVRAAGFVIPIVAAGKIRTPDLAEEILAQGRADIVGMARVVLCDPDWPAKAREGHADEIVRCAACGYCSEADERYEKIVCIQWPRGAQNAPAPWRLVPPCQAACPAGIDVRGYIDLAAQGHNVASSRLIQEKAPFPATLGRVCPRPCEARCNRRHLDKSIAIKALKRFIAERALPEMAKVLPVPRSREESIAIIGAGPAGLTAAFYLVKMGYGVTIFEALPFAGGMLKVGIPDYLLPPHIVETEVDAILKLGVELRLDSPVGESGLTIDSLIQKDYRAVLIATGAPKELQLNVHWKDKADHFDSFMKQIPDNTFLKDIGISMSGNGKFGTKKGFPGAVAEGIFAAGDVISGPRTVIEAIASGRREGLAIDRYLRGSTSSPEEPPPNIIDIGSIDLARFKKRDRQNVPYVAVNERSPGFPKVELGLGEMPALCEADRCLQCGMFPKKSSSG
ncbi:MAG: FAD-dependent oxidoreductase [Chloroflexi bacterium]|nr:FAD-dependent oxidoreductase [Chloroflexota bacterium]